MSELHQPSPDDLQLEALLRAASPAGGGSASDAAFEAGRREAMAQQRQALRLHRALTAAALVVSAGIGVQALTRSAPESSLPVFVERRPVNNAPPLRALAERPAMAQMNANSPYSYLSLRAAVLEGRSAEAIDFEPTSAVGPADGPETAPSLADLLREQRGL